MCKGKRPGLRFWTCWGWLACLLMAASVCEARGGEVFVLLSPGRQSREIIIEDDEVRRLLSDRNAEVLVGSNVLSRDDWKYKDGVFTITPPRQGLMDLKPFSNHDITVRTTRGQNARTVATGHYSDPHASMYWTVAGIFVFLVLASYFWIYYFPFRKRLDGEFHACTINFDKSLEFKADKIPDAKKLEKEYLYPFAICCVIFAVVAVAAVIVMSITFALQKWISTPPQGWVMGLLSIVLLTVKAISAFKIWRKAKRLVA